MKLGSINSDFDLKLKYCFSHHDSQFTLWSEKRAGTRTTGHHVKILTPPDYGPTITKDGKDNVVRGLLDVNHAGLSDSALG